MAAPPLPSPRSPAGRLDRVSDLLERLAAAQNGNLPALRLIEQANAELLLARADLEHQDESAQRARLDGALLVARTAAHQLNNALSPIVGYAELLGMLPAVRRDPTARSYATLIGESASHAAELVHRLQRIVRLEETPSPLGPDKPLLDLDRSAS